MRRQLVALLAVIALTALGLTACGLFDKSTRTSTSQMPSTGAKGSQQPTSFAPAEATAEAERRMAEIENRGYLSSNEASGFDISEANNNWEVYAKAALKDDSGKVLVTKDFKVATDLPSRSEAEKCVQHFEQDKGIALKPKIGSC